MPPLVILIDGHALAYRTYFALTRGSTGGRWITKDGEPTAGIYGFASVLMRILEQENPDYIAVAFDVGKTFRDELFSEYKATREKMPDDLRTQIERIRQMVDAFNIPRLELDGYEADDVLGSVAKLAASKGYGVKIFTGDRDLLQLVDDRIVVNLPGRSLADAKDYLSNGVKDYFGVYPDQVVDFKALVGDSSDNIPGVKGVGKVTAISLLETYNTLDAIYENLEELKPSVRKKLENDKENAYLSKTLATIVTDLDMNLDMEMAVPGNFDPGAVRELFRELEFRSLIKRLGQLESQYGIQPVSSGSQLGLFDRQHNKQDISITSPPDLKVHIINTPSGLDSLVQKLSDAKIIAFDTETTSTNKMEADLVGISLAVDEVDGYYIPVGHNQDRDRQLPMAKVTRALNAPFNNPAISKAGHNLKYDFIMLERNGIHTANLAFDSMIAEWLTNPASRNLGLKNLSFIRLDHQMIEIEKLIGSGRKQKTMAEVPFEDVARYAADDAVVVMRLMPELKQELETSNMSSLFSDIEMPLITILAKMEMIGISLDVEFLNSMSQELGSRLLELKDDVHDAIGTPFNINSTQQLSKALFETLKLAPPDRARRTASGYYSTAAPVLDAMRGVHPVVDWILEYRELAKLKSTYLDSLPLQVNKTSGRIHTSYNQTGSVTGRLASSDPNLQNIPIRTELGRKVRKAFVAAKGHSLLAVDYSQVELRIAAHMSNDDQMISAFFADQDIHSTTASAVFDVPLSEVSSDQRRHAKAINFGLIYGMSPFGLTRTTDLTLAEAEEFVATYFSKFPGVKLFLEEIPEKARKHGYVETLLGRRRYFPGLQRPGNKNVQRREEREAINSPIQGTAADILKLAMLKIPKVFEEKGLSAKMLLQVHDELVFECPSAELDETAYLVKKTMSEAFPLNVPLKTDASSGQNWGELQKLLI